MAITNLLEGWTSQECVFVLLLTSVGYSSANIIRNIYFHPLAKYPGPRLAAASGWWKAYVEAYKRESIVDRLFELHEKYGDVVRIAPDELHFSNPAVYNEIYSSRSRWDKDPKLYPPFGEEATTVTFTTLEYREAKRRRDLVAPLFSRKSVLSLQGVVQEGIDELCEVMAERAAEDKVVDIFRAFRCLDFDNVTSFCFGWSLHTLREPDFHALVVEQMHDGNTDYQFWKHHPLLRTLLLAVVRVVLMFMRMWGGEPKGYLEVYKKLKEQVDTYIDQPNALENAPHPLVYHTLLDPAQGMKLNRASLRDEGNLLIAAGTDTTSNASALGTVFALGGDGYIGEKLKAELRAAWPRLDEKPRLELLESLPYLKAVCKESLRLSHGVFSPMMRVVPPQGATLGGHLVPGGTKVGISNLFVHLNPTLFPDPHTFRPERWLEPGAESLDTWLVAFSKGPRSCLGINLGWCELYMNLANLFRRFDLKLEGGVQMLFIGNSPVRPYDLWHRDCFLPHYEGPDLLVRATPVLD